MLLSWGFSNTLGSMYNITYTGLLLMIAAGAGAAVTSERLGQMQVLALLLLWTQQLVKGSSCFCNILQAANQQDLERGGNALQPHQHSSSKLARSLAAGHAACNYALPSRRVDGFLGLSLPTVA
jgi:predicted lipid-binding transport protein (Tim44 family)